MNLQGVGKSSFPQSGNAPPSNTLRESWLHIFIFSPFGAERAREQDVGKSIFNNLLERSRSCARFGWSFSRT
jgi:hypothetical protein